MTWKRSATMRALGKYFFTTSPVGGGQIHAHYADVFFALQPLQIGLQRGLRAAQDHIIDGVILEVAQSGGVALAASKEVFVDAQDAGAARGSQLGELAPQGAPEVALDGRGPETFSPSQPAAVDAVKVVAKNHLLEGFARALPAKNARKTLTKVASAAQATEFAAFQFQDGTPRSHVLMPHATAIAALVP